MIEIDVFVEPFVSGSIVATVNQGLVDRVDVLHSALRGNPFVSRLEDSGVVEVDSNRIPDLFDLRVDFTSDIEVAIDQFDEFNGELIEVGVKFVQEDNLKVGVEAIISVLGTFGGGTELDVSEGKFNSLNAALSQIAESNGSPSWSVNPGIPVDLVDDAFGIRGVEVVSEEVIPCSLEIVSNNALLSEFDEIVLEEGLEGRFANKRLEVPEELESFLVVNLTHSIIGAGTIELRVKAGVAVSPSEAFNSLV
jgi:hypothetical protein